MRILSLISKCILEINSNVQLESNPTQLDENIQSIKNLLLSLNKDQYDNIITQIIDQICPNDTDPDIVKILKDIMDEIKHEIDNSNGNINTNIIMQAIFQRIKNKIPHDKLQKMLEMMSTK